MKGLRIWFWEHVHDFAEKLWHWTYSKRLMTLYPLSKGDPTYYFAPSVEGTDGKGELE